MAAKKHSAADRQAIRDRLRVGVENLDGSPVWVSYLGTPDELIEAGVAEPEMLAFGSSGTRQRCDEYGDRYRAQRHTDGRVSLDRELAAWSEVLPHSKHWRTAEAVVAAAIAAALKRRPAAAP
jgi:hypothetical protein